MKKLALALLLTIYAWPAQAQLRTQVVVTGLTNPIAYVADPLNAGVFFAVEQIGLVHVVQNGVVLPAPFLDLRGAIVNGGERGLLGFAFPPDPASGRVFVNFTNTAGDTVVARFKRSPANALVADPASRFDLRWPDGNRFITQPFANHNGGHLAFGSDGYLYVGLGDGGGGNDTQNAAQNPNTLLGKMLRIDVNVSDADPVGYRVPSDNPFLDGNPISALAEIWAFGLRNPWRYTFDEVSLGGTGAMFIGDVGQSAREEVNFEPARAGGRNYGWRMREGAIPTPGVAPTTPAFTPLTEPLFDYPRSIGTTVTGGYVYRGRALGAQYVGRYFVADFGSGRVFSIGWQPGGSGATVTSVVEHTTEIGNLGPISSFAQDLSGELYLILYASGRIVKIVPDSPAPAAPTNLQATVSGRTVVLAWTGVAGATQYRIEAGSQPGASNIAVFDTGSTATTLTVAGVPDGSYYVRVRAVGASGVSAASSEVLVTVGTACTGPPPAPTIAFAVNGRSVTFAWSAPGIVTSMVIDVGTAPGLTNLAQFVIPPGSTITANAGPGTYYVRFRSSNTCGTSGPSNEVAVVIQ